MTNIRNVQVLDSFQKPLDFHCNLLFYPLGKIITEPIGDPTAFCKTIACVEVSKNIPTVICMYPLVFQLQYIHAYIMFLSVL